MSAARGAGPKANALDVIEDAFHCVRAAPIGALSAYYLGSAPFVLVMIYFWADMANDAFAYRRVGIESLALAGLFLWMKTWQSIYARRLAAFVNDAPPGRLTVTAWMRTAARQTVLQATGFIVLPIALVALAPFGYAYAFYQNATVLDDGERVGFGDFLRRTWGQSILRPAQNHQIIWLLSPLLVGFAAATFFLILPIMQYTAPEWTEAMMQIYAGILLIILVPLSPLGMVVALNVAATLRLLPELLRMLFGVETVFSMNAGGMMTPTFFVMICGLTYLCLDPLLKAAYVMRCFYGESVQDGRDLRVRLKSLRGLSAGLVLVVGAMLLLCGTAQAQVPDEEAGVERRTLVSPAELDDSLDRVLESRQYAWRAPRERPTDESAIALLMKSIMQRISAVWEALWSSIREFLDWLFDRGSRDPADGAGGVSDTLLRRTVYVLIGALVLVLAVLTWRTWRRREPVIIVSAQTVAAAPDLEDEGTSADELPEEGWLRLARELLDAGDHRLAMRAFFFAGLARLAQRNLIRITRYKSNRDYARELERIEHEDPGILRSFRAGVRIFEAVWYGMHPATHENVTAFVGTQHEVMGRGE
ncbi:MAG: DUF4129 domain-containing protein [Candidatus Hydrogenedentes bacterium]|nr:DUF4129 domain-containing protein [Candidatus Hydrogenedentota bacterium]